MSVGEAMAAIVIIGMLCVTIIVSGRWGVPDKTITFIGNECQQEEFFE